MEGKRERKREETLTIVVRLASDLYPQGYRNLPLNTRSFSLQPFLSNILTSNLVKWRRILVGPDFPPPTNKGLCILHFY